LQNWIMSANVAEAAVTASVVPTPRLRRRLFRAEGRQQREHDAYPERRSQ
jgi:hypothetical protein